MVPLGAFCNLHQFHDSILLDNYSTNIKQWDVQGNQKHTEAVKRGGKNLKT